MTSIFGRILRLVERGEVRVSNHGYDELAADGILVSEIMKGVMSAHVVEEYPEYPKGPGVLVLQEDASGKPIHVVWGVPKNASSPAVLVTAYRPDAARWTDDFLRRR